MFLVGRWSLAESVTKARERKRIFWLEEPKEAYLLDEYRYPGKICVDVLQFDVLEIGDITEWIKPADMGELLGLPMAPHFSEEINVQHVS